MVDRSTIVEAIETYCKAQCAKDHEAWQGLFAQEVLHEDPVGFGMVRGKSDLVGPFWDRIVANDVEIWLTDEIIVCGNEALAILACDTGAPTDRRRLAPVVDHFVFDGDGRIASVRGFYNLPAPQAAATT